MLLPLFNGLIRFYLWFFTKVEYLTEHDGKNGEGKEIK